MFGVLRSTHVYASAQTSAWLMRSVRSFGSHRSGLLSRWRTRGTWGNTAVEVDGVVDEVVSKPVYARI